MQHNRTILAVADLMFGSKIRAAADAAGHRTVFARNEGALLAAAPDADIIMLDLATAWLTPALITQVKEQSRARVIAFAAHTAADVIQAARDAGADRVLARSGFVTQLDSLLRE